MLSAILKYLIAKLAAQGYIQEVDGLASTVKRDGERITGVFFNGELLHINFDNYQSYAFFMQKGRVDRDTEEDRFLANVYRITETYPLSIILYVQNTEDINCESKAQNTAWSIAQLLTGKHPNLMATTGLQYIGMRVTGIDLDGPSIYESIFSGDSRLKDDDILIEINFSVTIEGEEKCFTTYPCEVQVQGDSDTNTAFGTDETNNNEVILANP